MLLYNINAHPTTCILCIDKTCEAVIVVFAVDYSVDTRHTPWDCVRVLMRLLILIPGETCNMRAYQLSVAESYALMLRIPTPTVISLLLVQEAEGKHRSLDHRQM